MPVFSIVIPVYNAESTLAKCLDSLKAQTFHDFQAIMVENGSKDCSAEICREYAKADARFELFSMSENRGPSGARNTGLDYANGQYIAFVDSDDYVVPEYLHELHTAFTENDADVVFMGYRAVTAQGEDRGEHIPIVAENSDNYDKILSLSKQDMFGYTWIKAFRAEIVGSHRFPENLNLFEDEVLACRVLPDCRRVEVIAKPLYNYVVGNAGSLVGRTHQDYCQKCDAVYMAWKELLEKYPQKSQVLTEKANAFVNRCMYYGFERDVTAESFWRALSGCTFFKENENGSDFCFFVENRYYKKLSLMRFKYRTKTVITRLLKR